jgi:signal transduction histidine kinase
MRIEDALDSDLSYETLIHDLNNIFETITEGAELLKADRRWKQLGLTLCRTVNRGKRLVGAIPDSTPYLASVVDDAIQSVNDYCAASRRPRVRFIRQIPAETRLPGAAKDWERVFANLFLNTVQIIRKPSRIEVSAQRQDGFLNIVVCDDGPGIPLDILPRMFRSNVSTKRNTSGRSGLGLHIVASIVKKHSGRIAAANRERSSGAEFTISLPEA